MSRLLVTSVDKSWYDELAIISSYYEAEFEKIIKQHVKNVFPDYYTISYKKTVTADYKEDKKPDLALIHKDYSNWWIIEVELNAHPLSHVISQVDVFSNGNYNSIETADYINNQCKKELNINLDINSLRKLIANEQPRVLVIVDEPKHDWEEKLAKFDAQLFVFQVFKNTAGSEAYRLNGYYPETILAESHCKYVNNLPNTLEIINPSIFEIDDESIILNQFAIIINDIKMHIKKISGISKIFEILKNLYVNKNDKDKIRIKYNGRITLWIKFDSKEKVLLRAIGINSVPVNHDYVLYRDALGTLNLKMN